jgi:hypothetical protein
LSALLQLEAAYRATCYRVQAPEAARFIDLRVESCHPELDARLALAGQQRWALLTAWNPGSRLCSPEKNALAQGALRAEIARAGWDCWPARHIALHGDWPDEEGLFVPGIGPEQALALARQFGQNAMLAGEVGQVARLLWTLSRG